LVDKISAVPSNLIDKGQSAIDASRASNQNRIDAIADGEDPATAAKTSATVPVDTTSSVGPGVTATTTDSEAAAATASTAFRTFIADAKIDGVFQGHPPKVLVNSRVIREGETVDIGLGIILDRVDVGNKILYFKDKSGSSVSKRY
jgi:hypothetical protein